MTLHQSRSRRFSLKPRAYQTLIFLFSCVSIVSLTPSVTLSAYVPPGSSQPSTITSSNGTRGLGSCGKEPRGKLTALAPLNHVGQTTATHPTFAWYVPDVDVYPIDFRLYSYGSNGEALLVKQIWLQSKKGIMHYSLPKSQVGLTVGQTYLWQVAVLCKADESDIQELETEVKVMTMPVPLQSSLATTSDRLQRANLYAKAGFWYDALAEALATDETRKIHKTQPFVITLLEDLLKLEPPGTSESPKQHDQLKQVVEIEQR